MIEVSWFNKADVKLPWFYGFTQEDPARAYDIYHPIPLNYITRYVGRAYWKFIKSCFWVGVIDTQPACEFWWGDFWRIRQTR